MKWGSPAKLAGMTDSLAGLKNIGPATIRQLKEVGIDDVATLRQLGAMAAYRRLKHAFPRQVSLVMLYALEGGLRHQHWNRLPPGVKEALKREAQIGSGPRACAVPMPRRSR